MVMFLLSLEITLHFDVLIFMPHFLQACSSLSVAIWRWSMSWSRSVVSSAYLMLFICIWPIWIPLSRFWTSFMISSRKRLNKLGDSRQPWRTPVITSNHSLIEDFTNQYKINRLLTYSNTLFSHFWQIYFWTSKAGIMVLYKARRTCYSFMGSFFHDHKKMSDSWKLKIFFLLLSLQKVSYKSPSPCTSCAL